VRLDEGVRRLLVPGGRPPELFPVLAIRLKIGVAHTLYSAIRGRSSPGAGGIRDWMIRMTRRSNQFDRIAARDAHSYFTRIYE
jgi:hypothetical protein